MIIKRKAPHQMERMLRGLVDIVHCGATLPFCHVESHGRIGDAIMEDAAPLGGPQSAEKLVPTAGELANPFQAVQKEGKPKTLKYCVWEVLKEQPRGMKVTEIIDVINDRGLYNLKAAKNPSGQVHA